MVEDSRILEEKTIYKIGFWSALVAFVAAFGFDVAQILQLN